jgi:hypothetical protein
MPEAGNRENETQHHGAAETDNKHDSLPACAQHDLAAARLFRVIGLSSLPHTRPTSPSGTGSGTRFCRVYRYFFANTREALSLIPINASAASFKQYDAPRTSFLYEILISRSQ